MLRGTVLILFLLTTTLARPNETPMFIGGGSAGYVRLSVPKTSNGITSLPPQSNPYPASLGLGIAFNGGVKFPLNDQWHIGARLGGAYNTIDFTTTEPTLFNVGGVPTPGTFQHDLQLHWWSGIFSAFVGFNISNKVGFRLLADVEFPFSMSGTGTETIIDPSGVTYTNGDTSRIRVDGDENSKISFIVGGQIFYSIPISNSSSIQPFISFSTHLSSLSTQNDLLPTSLSVGLNVTLPLGGNATQQAKLPTTHADTAIASIAKDTAFDEQIVSPQTKKFLATALDIQLQSGSNSKASSVRIFTKLRLVMESNTSNERVFGATAENDLAPVRRYEDTVVGADPPRAIIHSTTIADAGLEGAEVKARVNSTVVWNKQWKSNSDTTFIWELKELPGRILTQDTLEIRFTSDVYDILKSHAQSIPVDVTLTRESTGTANREKPDYIEARFDSSAFTQGNLNSAGRGLVAALMQYIEKADSVSIFGSRELIKIFNEAVRYTAKTQTTPNSSNSLRVLLTPKR